MYPLLDSMKYKFKKNLGNGSYGEVILAEDINKNSFAIKKFPLRDKSSYASFKNEVKILKRIKHKNLIKIYDYYKDRSYIYLVMEYAPLGDLDNYIRCLQKKGKIISQNTIDNIISQVTEGIDYLHCNNIIHRDIKTSNILVFNDNLFKITDFGISKNIANAHFAYTNIGTPYYMAPEIFSGRPYTYSVDYWALGCMIYKLLTDKYPFEALNIGALVLKIKKGKVNLNKLPYRYRELLSKLLTSQTRLRGNKKDVFTFLKNSIINNKQKENSNKKEIILPKINQNLISNIHNKKNIYKKLENNDFYQKVEKEKSNKVILPPLYLNNVKPKIDCWNLHKIKKEKKLMLKKKKLPPIHLKDIHKVKSKEIPMKNNKKDFIRFNRENIILMHKR